MTKQPSEDKAGKATFISDPMFATARFELKKEGAKNPFRVDLDQLRQVSPSKSSMASYSTALNSPNPSHSKAPFDSRSKTTVKHRPGRNALNKTSVFDKKRSYLAEPSVQSTGRGAGLIPKNVFESKQEEIRHLINDCKGKLQDF